MKKKIITSSLVVAATLGLSIGFISTQLDDVVAAQIDSNIVNISEGIEEQISNNSLLAMSSNPYDYIENNEYYDNIVKLGVDALPILQERLEHSPSNGLVEYIMAIAIEDISDCDLKENKEYKWSSPDEFSDNWSNFVKYAEEKIDTILNSNASEETKIKELEKYGKLSAHEVKEYIKENNDNKEIKTLQKFYDDLDISESDTKKIETYLNE